LENYYKQITLDESFNNMLKAEMNWNFPNAIYINGVDFDGTIRTGLEVLWGKNRNLNDQHTTTGYAYVDTIIGANLVNSCYNNNNNEDKDTCDKMMSTIQSRRAKNPMLFWNDADYGRLTEWKNVF